MGMPCMLRTGQPCHPAHGQSMATCYRLLCCVILTFCILLCDAFRYTDLTVLTESESERGFADDFAAGGPSGRTCHVSLGRCCAATAGNSSCGSTP